MHDVLTAGSTASPSARPDDAAGLGTGPTGDEDVAPRDQLLRDGLRLVVDGIVSSLPGACAGVFSVGPHTPPSLLALATSSDTDAGTEDVARVVAQAREAASGHVTTRVSPHHTQLPLRDRVGRPRGLLFVDSDDAAPPLTAVSSHALLTAYANQAESEIRGSVEQQALDERVRLAETAREVVRHATSWLKPEEAVAAIEQTLREGFRADLVRLRPHAAGLADFPGTIDPPLSKRALALTVATSRALWAKREVAVYELGSEPDDLIGNDDHRLLVGLMRELGLASTLLVPLGFRSSCLGHLVLGRNDPSVAWSDQEARVALEIGGDLGRAIHNLESLTRERKLAREMRALDTAKGRLITDVSHQLRNPLSTIVGHLELVGITDDGTAPEVSRSLRAMERNAVRLRRMVEDLTLLARVGDPTSAREAADVDVAAVAREVVELVGVSAEQAGITLELRLPDRPVTAWGDAGEIDRALSNLVSNAVKYGHPGGRVELEVCLEGAEVVLACRDDGLGIAEEDLPSLFSEFFRSTNPDALHRPGTGLGLAIVQRIAHRHGGRVQVSSALGQGSEFRLFLPVPPASATGAGLTES